MFLPGDCEEAMKVLGDRLRHERLGRNESQKVFSARIGTTIPTLLKMEKGNPTVQFGLWVNALDILNRLSDLNHILTPQEDLFAKYERMRMPRTRKRASRKKTSI
jgi:transcriptional regulator with XRE-family HTH domain